MGGVYIRIQLLEDLNQTYSSPGCHSLRQSGRGGTFYRPTPILSEGLGGKPSERTSTRHRDRPGTEPRAFHIICHLSLATALADEDYGLHFTGRKAKAHKDYFSKKATELVSRVLAQSQLAEDSFTKYTKLIDSSMKGERSRNWKNKQTIKMNMMTSQRVQRPGSSLSSLTSLTSLPEIHSCHPVPHLFIHSNSY